MSLIVFNSAYATLAAGIIAGDTAIPLSAGQGARFPLTAGQWTWATLIKSDGTLEIIKLTARAVDTLTATRGQDSTTAVAFSAGDRIECRPCNAAIQDLLQLSGGTVIGAVTFVDGSLKLSGATSGTTIIKAAAVAGAGTLTFPVGTDTLTGKATTDTLSNKRVTLRTGTVASSATPTINTDNVDLFSITALAAAITSMTTNLTGTPVAGDALIIEITDNGTARAITWGASFEASTVALPTTTVISTKLTVGFIWNTTTSKWRCMGVA